MLSLPLLSLPLLSLPLLSLPLLSLPLLFLPLLSLPLLSLPLLSLPLLTLPSPAALRLSALELTCRAPRESICGGGSTLSEYELYFNFARHEFNSSVVLRQGRQVLLWANGAGGFRS